MKKLTGAFIVVAVAIVTAIVYAQSVPAYPAVTINYQDFEVYENGVEIPRMRQLVRVRPDGSTSTQNFDRDPTTPTFRDVLDLQAKRYQSDDLAKVVSNLVVTNNLRNRATAHPCRAGCFPAGKILGYDVETEDFPVIRDGEETGSSRITYIAPSLGYRTLRIEWRTNGRITSYRVATYVTMGVDEAAFSYPADYESTDPLGFILNAMRPEEG